MKIEKGIPIPDKKTKYPFRNMEVGDSFVSLLKDRQKLASAANGYQTSNTGVKFVIRTISETEIRLWRIS